MNNDEVMMMVSEANRMERINLFDTKFSHLFKYEFQYVFIY